MNRIVIIGNGFDLAHGLRTSYRDFIDALWEREKEIITTNELSYYHDFSDSCYYYIYENAFIKIRSTTMSRVPENLATGYGYLWFKNLKEHIRVVEVQNAFLKTISEKTHLQTWVDIEEEYYRELNACLNDKRKGGITKLNGEFSVIKTALGVYLEKLQKNVSPKSEIHQHLKMDSHNGTSIDNTLFLNFNYTDIIENYIADKEQVIYIHGKLNAPENPIIFGYGNEQDETHKLIEAKNDNEYLRHIKSIEYLKTNNYKRLQAFIESDEYEIFIMGHSCGNSDRTLLNNLFEHKHCRSIRVFYYKRADGTDDHFDLECNIYRNFNDKNAMRNKVVSKEDCVPLL